MSDLNYDRDQASRDSSNRTTWAIVVAVVVSVIVAGVCISSSYDNDKSSAVRNDPPQAEMAP